MEYFNNSNVVGLNNSQTQIFLAVDPNNLLRSSAGSAMAAPEVPNPGTSRKRIAKKYQGLSKEEAEAKRRKINAQEKERMARTVAGFNKIDSVLPAYNLKRENEKMSQCNLLHDGANFIKLLSLAMEYKIPMDSDPFQKGVLFLKRALDSRWTNDLFVNNTIEDLFKSAREKEIICFVPQHNSACDSGSILDTTGMQSVSAVTHNMQDETSGVPVINDTTPIQTVLGDTYKMQKDYTCAPAIQDTPTTHSALGATYPTEDSAPVISGMPPVHHISGAIHQQQWEITHAEVQNESQQPLMSSPNDHSSCNQMPSFSQISSNKSVLFPATDINQNVIISTHMPSISEASAQDPQASGSQFGQTQSAVKSITYEVLNASQNVGLPQSCVQASRDAITNNAQVHPLIQLIASSNQIAELPDSNYNNDPITQPACPSTFPPITYGNIATVSVPTSGCHPMRNETVAFPTNVTLGDDEGNDKENNYMQFLTGLSFDDSISPFDNTQVEATHAVPSESDVKAHLSIHRCSQQNPLIDSHRSDNQAYLHETLQMNVDDDAENVVPLGTALSQISLPSKTTVHVSTPEEPRASLSMDDSILGRDREGEVLGHELNTPVKKGRKPLVPTSHGQPLSNPTNHPLVCSNDHEGDANLEALISFCQNS